MTLQTMCRALGETIAERINDADLDDVTLQAAGDVVVIRHFEWSVRIEPEIAASVLYQIEDLQPGSPATALHGLAYF